MKRTLMLFVGVTVLFGMLAVHAVAWDLISPEEITASQDGRDLYLTERTTHRVAVCSVSEQKLIGSVSLPGEPTGLCLSGDGRTLYVTCSFPVHLLCAIDLAKREIVATVPTGAGPCHPAIDWEKRRMYVCNQYDNSVSVIDLAAQKETVRLPAGREPIAAVFSPRQHLLFVASHLPAGVSTAEEVAASISVVDTNTLQTRSEIPLPNGSTCVKGMCISPDEKYIFVTHLLSRYTLPTTQLDRGWMINNALSVVDAENWKPLGTVLLDDMDRGAANPWAVACTPDGRYLCVTHAGTHELSRIDLPALLKRVSNSSSSNPSEDVSFIKEFRQRVPLQGRGPRGMAIVDQTAYVTHHFTDNLNTVDLTSGSAERVETIPLTINQGTDARRLGEMYFHDATICFQGWQSCSSCHPDGRVDGLNWDLLNDGIGNPKNTKSLLLAFQTPPSMSTSVRENAQQAVRSGLKHILLNPAQEEVASALDEYIRTLTPLPSLVLRDESNRKAALRGKDLFFSSAIGCAECHGGAYYTDMKPYDVGTRNATDDQNEFDTPTLVELWRTAPYLHDGSAATLRDVLTEKNAGSRHGNTAHLSEAEIADLAAFLESL